MGVFQMDRENLLKEGLRVFLRLVTEQVSWQDLMDWFSRNSSSLR